MMNTLKLKDEILLSVEKPARYIGQEINMIYKNPSDCDIRFAFCFPDIYEIGMSYLGLQILYYYLNLREDTYFERVFSPWIDLVQILKEENIPLFALESQDDIKDFDFLGFTLQYEMSYTNILNILELSQIPIFAKDRTDEHPIVCAGGPCAYNPEPLADFIDFFYIGEGEAAFDKILDIYKENKLQNGSKTKFLEKLLSVEGIYIPKYYDVTYNDNNTIQSFIPNNPKAKPTIKKQIVMNVDELLYPDKPIVPHIQTVHDRVVIELFRGCIRGCRFCQAGMIYRPVREKSVKQLKNQANTLLKNTGHDEISLISLSSSDYTKLKELTESLIDDFKDKGINISLPSLRIDAFSLDIMSKIQDVRKSSLTFAPEAGSQRMRNVINKGLTEEDILTGAKEAFKGGWNRVKLYFMLGLPSETYEDIESIAKLGQSIVDEYFQIPKEHRKGRINIVISTSFFVPKAFTPFQWSAQDNYTIFMEKQKFLNSKINKRYIKYNSHDAKLSMLEGIIARGDRKIGKLLYEAYKLGCTFDSWSDHFDYSKWEQAFINADIDPSFYTTRQRSFEEILPWDFIDTGVTKEFLYREYEHALKEKETPHCRKGCANCGLKILGGGVCYENKN